MKKALLLATCLVCGSLPLLHAQQPSPARTPRPVPPPGPLLNKAPDFAQWTVISRTVIDPATAPSATPSPSGAPVASASPKAKPSPPPTDLTTTVTKTRTIRFEQSVGTGGFQIQKWCVPDMQIIIQGTSNPVVAMPGGTSSGGDAVFTDYGKADFEGFGWISKRNFDGIEKVMGQDCLVFRDKLKLTGDSARSGPPPTGVACINADSRLPVALQLGEESRTYQFGPAPTDMLAIPPKVDAVINQWRKTLRQASLPPGKP